MEKLFRTLIIFFSLFYILFSYEIICSQNYPITFTVYADFGSLPGGTFNLPAFRFNSSFYPAMLVFRPALNRECYYENILVNKYL